MTDDPYVERLTPLDMLMPRTYIRVLLVFPKANPTLAVTQNLQHGLDRLSKQVPWLSGRIFLSTPTQPNPSPEIRSTRGTTPTLINKGSIRASYATLSSQGMPIKALPSDIWPVPNIIDPLSTTPDPVFATSFFRFADQGMGLCICIHHNATDATGFSEIVHRWARNIANPDTLFARHPEYSPHPPTMPTEYPPCTSKLFTISLHWLTILKVLLRKHTPHPDKQPTTHTILCALLWTTITRIRTHRSPALKTKPSNLITAVNARPRLFLTNPHPNQNQTPYLSNTILYGQTTHPAKTLATADEDPIRSLATICELISESHSPSRINSRFVAEVYRLVEDRGELFPGWDLFHSRDLVITSWANLGVYGVEFGGGIGRPRFVRVECGEADGVVVVLPRRRGVVQGVKEEEEEEGVEVVVMLRADDMEGLEADEMWGMVTGGKGGN
ncbi:hypothetical protein ASPCADRAFT_42102 [Aspergillus carbonarius ITEM 5010]|uniref:Transferase family protein n=1 Tax=Aspergillus carbonarius (strain ITEM 5010) TaxID=602072 RepID=A0A1R3RW69_ASPC5|nr:hypothetical protein ASPCADRAFT_42102 [Aspergillus carbonarius ITEM 5010]